MCGDVCSWGVCCQMHVAAESTQPQLLLSCMPPAASAAYESDPPMGRLFCLCLVSMLCDVAAPTAPATALLLGRWFHLHIRNYRPFFPVMVVVESVTVWCFCAAVLEHSLAATAAPGACCRFSTCGGCCLLPGPEAVDVRAEIKAC